MQKINRDFFKNPVNMPEFSVSGFWFWNDLIEDETTSEQLSMMHRIHADQPVIHARSGLLTTYLSDDWFDRIRAVIEGCKKTGQRIWLYDEHNWPSGNCGWTITRDEKYREHFISFDATGKARIQVDDYEGTGKFSVDYLSKEAIGKFIESTHEKYKAHFKDEFGKSIQGFFMDETRFCNAFPWTSELASEFKKRKGYDIETVLPQLWSGAPKTKERDIARYDYYDVVSDLYAENTFGQVFDWCEANNLVSCGHLLGEETLATQSYFGADVLRTLRYLHIPGIDHLGNGIGSLDAKFFSSAAHHYGKDRVACEALGGAGWDMTYEDMVRISNWLFQQGINLIMIHGLYYSIRDERVNDWPPSYFFQWKYWDKMKEYVPMANRMMEMLSGGMVECEILVFSPMETFQSHFEPDLEFKTCCWNEGPWIADEKAKYIDNQFQLLCNRLCDENLDYEILGTDAVQFFKVEKNRLINLVTGATYSVLVLPCVEILSGDAVTLIEKFAAEGGLVINYQSSAELTLAKDGSHRNKTLPPLDKSKLHSVQKIRDIADLCARSIKLPFDIISGPDRMEHSKSSYPPRIIDPYIHNGERVYGVGVSRYKKEDARIFNFTNYNEKTEELRVWVSSPTPPELFNPESGEMSRVANHIARDGGFEFDLALPANRARFVVCGA